jgi:peptidoglycan pentaglycine glycine transferase (the first glycine)
MELIELTESDRQNYNSFVAAQESGSFLQSWEWGEWQSAVGRQVKRLKLKVESGDTAATIQLIKMPLPFGKYYLYAPYGPVLAEGESNKLQVASYRYLIEELQKKFVDAVFIRIESKVTFNFQLSTFNSPIYKSANIQPGKTLVIDLTKPEDQLLAEMHAKTRYNIKLAQKHGVEVQDEFVLTNGKGLYAKEAVELIAKTAGRQNYKTQGLGYFEKLVNFFAIQNPKADLKLHIYKALYNKELLTSAIILDFGDTRTYLFGGSSDSHREVMAPHLLHWTAIEDAKKIGIKYYDFWGIETASGQTPGFVRFKLGFSGQTKQYPGAWDIVSRGLYYNLYKGLRYLNRRMR